MVVVLPPLPPVVVVVVVVVVVEPPPVFPPPGRPPKPWFAGGTFELPGLGGGATPLPFPLSGGGVGPLGEPVKVKLLIFPPADFWKSGICALCVPGERTSWPPVVSVSLPICAGMNPPRSSWRSNARYAWSRVEAMITPCPSGASEPGSGDS